MEWVLSLRIFGALLKNICKEKVSKLGRQIHKTYARVMRNGPSEPLRFLKPYC
jgi:hypothetical protein